MGTLSIIDGLNRVLSKNWERVEKREKKGGEKEWKKEERKALRKK